MFPFGYWSVPIISPKQVGMSREKVAQAQMYAIKSLESQIQMLQDAEEDLFLRTERQLRDAGLDAQADELVASHLNEAARLRDARRQEEIRRMLAGQVPMTLLTEEQQERLQM